MPITIAGNAEVVYLGPPARAVHELTLEINSPQQLASVIADIPERVCIVPERVNWKLSPVLDRLQLHQHVASTTMYAVHTLLRHDRNADTLHRNVSTQSSCR